MTELGQVEIKKRLLSGVVDCELLSDTYKLISALQAEILELKAHNVVKDERISELEDTIHYNAEMHSRRTVNATTMKPRKYIIKRDKK